MVVLQVLSQFLYPLIGALNSRFHCLDLSNPAGQQEERFAAERLLQVLPNLVHDAAVGCVRVARRRSHVKSVEDRVGTPIYHLDLPSPKGRRYVRPRKDLLEQVIDGRPNAQAVILAPLGPLVPSRRFYPSLDLVGIVIRSLSSKIKREHYLPDNGF